jgi:hypothetical protein
MEARTLFAPLGDEDAKAGAGAMLAASRLAGLSALERHYAGVNGRARNEGPTRDISVGRPRLSGCCGLRVRQPCAVLPHAVPAGGPERLARLRGPSETFSHVILRLAAAERG